VQSQVTVGTSTLFLLTSGVVMDKVVDEIKPHDLYPVLISSNLSTEEESKLQETFAAEPS
jgi:uncharacterized membrane protein